MGLLLNVFLSLCSNFSNCRATRLASLNPSQGSNSNFSSNFSNEWMIQTGVFGLFLNFPTILLQRMKLKRPICFLCAAFKLFFSVYLWSTHRLQPSSSRVVYILYCWEKRHFHQWRYKHFTQFVLFIKVNSPLHSHPFYSQSWADWCRNEASGVYRMSLCVCVGQNKLCH